MKKEKTEKKPVILLLGKLPPPYMGPAIATEIILNSRLKDEFKLIHLDTRLNKELSGLGTWRWGKVFRQLIILAILKWKIVRYRPQLVWIPISQTTSGFLKDSLYILTARFLGRKVLVHLRGSDFKNWLKRSSRTVNWYVKRVLKRCAGVIVLGNCLRYLFADYFPEEKIFVVPNGADYEFLQDMKKSEKRLRIAYLGNLQPAKGIEDVVRAIMLVEKMFPGMCELSVVGTWRDEKTRSKCEQLVENNSIAAKFMPPKVGNKKLNFLKESDLLVFTPRHPEGHPWVIVEAMAAGLPLISTDRGAIKESVIDGYNGFIVAAESPNQIAEKISIFVKDRGKLRTMGQASRKHYLANFTEDHMAKNVKTVINRIIGE